MPANGPQPDVFPLNLGGNVFGWTADERESFAVLDAFVDGGGRLIDTADSYLYKAPGNVGGESEGIIGRWLQRRGRRDDVLIATKVGKFPVRPGLSYANIVGAIDDSLRRLQTDYVDLYYAHQDDPTVPLDETFEAFDALVRAGKVRALGGSNYSAARTAEVLEVQRRNELKRWTVIQPEFNLLEREFERELQPLAQREGLATMPYYALASGFLTGKYRGDGELPQGARTERASRYLNARGDAVLAALDGVASEHEVPVASVAIAWLRAQPTVVAPIASARTVEQLGPLMTGARLELDDAQRARLDEASRVPLS